MYLVLDTYPTCIHNVSDVSRCILRDTTTHVLGLYLHFKVRIHTWIQTRYMPWIHFNRYIPDTIPDTNVSNVLRVLRLERRPRKTEGEGCLLQGGACEHARGLEVGPRLPSGPPRQLQGRHQLQVLPPHRHHRWHRDPLARGAALDSPSKTYHRAPPGYP